MKRRESKEVPPKNPLISALMNVSFRTLQHMIKDFTLNRSVKKLDKNNERFDTVENLLVKCETKINDLRSDLDRLKIQLFWSNAVIIVGVLLIIFKLVL